MLVVDKVCPVCGTDFVMPVTRGRPRRCCGPECAAEYHRVNARERARRLAAGGDHRESCRCGKPKLITSKVCRDCRRPLINYGLLEKLYNRGAGGSQIGKLFGVSDQVVYHTINKLKLRKHNPGGRSPFSQGELEQLAKELG